MRIFELRCDVDRFVPWTRDDGELGVVADLVPRGTPVGDRWTPLHGHLRPIARHRRGDFPFWLDPVFSDRAREGLADLCGAHGEWLPLITPPPDVFWIFNVTTVIDCLDEDRSSLRRFPDGRPFAATRLVFDADRVDPDAHCFRIPQGLTTTFYVTDTFVDRVEELGLLGLAPRQLWDRELGSWPIDLLA